MTKTYTIVSDEDLIKVLPKNGEALSTTQVSTRLQIGSGTVASRMAPLIADGKVQKIQLNGKTKGYKIPCK